MENGYFHKSVTSILVHARIASFYEELVVIMYIKLSTLTHGT